MPIRRLRLQVILIVLVLSVIVVFPLISNFYMFKISKDVSIADNSPVGCYPLNPTAENTIANQINLSMNTITDWYDSSNLFARGIVLGKVNISELDNIIQEKQSDNNWQEVLAIKRYSEILNYSSSVINESVKWALDYTPMFDNYSLPMTESGGFFWIWKQYTLYGFRYARELNHNTSKWNAFSAYTALKNCRITNGRSFYQCNPDTNVTSSLFYTRWMNTANLANCFMILYSEIGQQEVLDFALQEWEDLNSYYWNSMKIGFDYSRTWRIWEWSTIEVIFNFAKILALNKSLVHWERIYFDLQTRYLAKGWNSSLWNSKGKVVLHWKDVTQESDQRRLHGTLDAWMLLHTYFGYFILENQNKMRKMLEGDIDDDPAWYSLLSEDAALYNPINYRFKMDSNGFETDYGTAEGCITLFLLGISPQNGSGLIIPKRCFGYSAEPLPMDVFKFLYHEQEIIIPVYANTTLKFLYGNSYPTYNFPYNGLYRITFTDDWNSIKLVELIKEIAADIPCSIPYPSSTPSTIDNFSSTTDDFSSTIDDSSVSSTTSLSSSITSSSQQTSIFSIVGIQIGLILLAIRRIKKKK